MHAGEGLYQLCERKRESKPKISLKETIIVEGRYDRIRLSEFIASPIIETGGFRVFKDKEKQTLIRRIAEKRGILVMTDVDSAGFVIRNFLRGLVPEDQILHADIPTVMGKERRKSEASKEGILGVEGIDREMLIEAIRKSGAHIINSHCEGVSLWQSQPMIDRHSEERQTTRQTQPVSDESVGEGLAPPVTSDTNGSIITKQDFYDYGLTGSENSARYREEVLVSLGLPKYLTTNAMIAAIHCLFSKDEFEAYLNSL